MPPGWLNLLFAVILQSLGLRDGQAEAQRAVDRLHHSSFPQILMHEKNKKTAHCRRADRQTTGVWTHAGACACLFGCTCGSVWWYTVKTAWMHEYFISFLILKSTLIKFNNISVVFCIVGDDLAVDIFGRPQVFFPLLSFWFILTSTPLLPHFLLFFRLLLLSAIPALYNSEWNDVRTASVWITPIFSHESRQTFPLSPEKVQLRLMRSV